MRRGVFVCLILLGLLSIGVFSCRSQQTPPDADGLSGRILLWHAWTDSDADVLTEVIAAFRAIHPQVSIQQKNFESEEELRQQFEGAVPAGLGPDAVLAPTTWIRSLADQGAIDSIDAHIPADLLNRYLPSAVQMTGYEDAHYAIPESLNTMALYYNRRLVEKPASTVDELLDQAADGKQVLMSTGFFDSFWGVQAFGGRLFDEEGRAILNRGGFANWLAWLKAARDAPGMILDDDREEMRSRFMEGDAAYYIGDGTDRGLLTEALGDDVLGVSLLPSGPNGSAGPFLATEAFLFSTVSSANQREIALEFAEFMTNAEQSAILMRKGAHIPANSNVRINPRLYPVSASLATQARSAVAVQNSLLMDAVWKHAGDAHRRVLDGVLTPAEAATMATIDINDANGMQNAVVPEPDCIDLGTIRLVHELQGPAAAALDETIRRFRRVCPLIIVESKYENLTQIRDRWANDPTSSSRPDIVLASQTWLLDALLVDGIPLKDIRSSVPAELWQQYRPSAVNAMRAENGLFGLPESIEVHALYFNKELIEEPASNLSTLRIQSLDGTPIVIDTRFSRALWALGAFGGALFDIDNHVILDQGGFAEWLQWLKESRDTYGVQLSNEGQEIKTLFEQGQSAYYVGTADEHTELSDAIGAENLQVAILPSGPLGNASPLLLASGYFFSDALSDSEFHLALKFVEFATSAENQTLVAEMTDRIPANATLDLSDRPFLSIFSEQAELARGVPNMHQIRRVAELGDQAYVDVLESGADPQVTVAAVTRQMNEALGFEPLVGPDDTQDEAAGREESSSNDGDSEAVVDQSGSVDNFAQDELDAQ